MKRVLATPPACSLTACTLLRPLSSRITLPDTTSPLLNSGGELKTMENFFTLSKSILRVRSLNMCVHNTTVSISFLLSQTTRGKFCLVLLSWVWIRSPSEMSVFIAEGAGPRVSDRLWLTVLGESETTEHWNFSIRNYILNGSRLISCFTRFHLLPIILKYKWKSNTK